MDRIITITLLSDDEHRALSRAKGVGRWPEEPPKIRGATIGSRGWAGAYIRTPVGETRIGCTWEIPNVYAALRARAEEAETRLRQDDEQAAALAADLAVGWKGEPPHLRWQVQDAARSAGIELTWNQAGRVLPHVVARLHARKFPTLEETVEDAWRRIRAIVLGPPTEVELKTLTDLLLCRDPVAEWRVGRREYGDRADETGHTLAVLAALEAA